MNPYYLIILIAIIFVVFLIGFFIGLTIPMIVKQYIKIDYAKIEKIIKDNNEMKKIKEKTSDTINSIFYDEDILNEYLNGTGDEDE